MRKIYGDNPSLRAFTLAEILITLAIIGVVASLTIPALIKNTTDKQLMVMLRKDFSVISQAIKLLEAEKGTINVSSATGLRDDFETVMSFVKKGAWKDLSAVSYNFYKSDTKTDHTGWAAATAVMPDGSVWGFWPSWNPNCTGTENELNGICADIRLDVNGAKPPNMYGKDLFWLWMVKTNSRGYVIYPFGSNGDARHYCSPGKAGGQYSMGCTAEALRVSSPDEMP